MHLPPLLPIPLLPLLFLYLSLPIPTLASSGDRSPQFQSRLEACSSLCSPSPNAIPASLPLSLRLTRWTCLDECKYQSMWGVVNEVEPSRGGGVQQFYGKWPFHRLGGIQEPASVLFSIANGLMHYRGMTRFARRTRDGNPLKAFYYCWGIAGVNTWIWSSVFHIRDKPWTEKLDYFSAGLGITYSLFFTLVRIYHLYPTMQSSTPSPTLRMLGAGFILLFLGHVSYLSFSIPFDYTYNILYNVLLGVSHNLLWFIWTLSFYTSSSDPVSLPPPSLTKRPSPSFPSQTTTLFSTLIPPQYPSSSQHIYNHSRPSHLKMPAITAILFTLAMTFELFDFPPVWGVFDAHSLWHAATVGIVPIWWGFLEADAAWWDGESRAKETFGGLR